MITQNIARRYGKAFFEIAREDSCYEIYFNQLKIFTELLERQGNLKSLLKNPVFGPDERRAVLEDVLSKLAFSPMVVSFLLFLADEKRIEWIEQILDSYRFLVDEAQGILRVSVRAAHELSPEMIRSLDETLKGWTSSKVEMSFEEDPSLLGGVVIRIGDAIYDGTLKKQLMLLQNDLMSWQH